MRWFRHSISIRIIPTVSALEKMGFVSINLYHTAIDNIRHHIRVNAICPSWVNTPMMHLKMQQVPKLEKFVEKMSPLGRMATVEEVAEIIVFMCSGSASYVNGTGLLVDAGLSLTAHTGKLISFGYLGGEASKDYKVFSSKF